MVLRNLVQKLAPRARNIHTTSVVRDSHDTRGIYGSNLPFGVHNRFLLLVNFVLFFGSGIALPFISLRSMILAKNQ